MREMCFDSVSYVHMHGLGFYIQVNFQFSKIYTLSLSLNSPCEDFSCETLCGALKSPLIAILIEKACRRSRLW